jgi:hypothetical protein
MPRILAQIVSQLYYYLYFPKRIIALAGIAPFPGLDKILTNLCAVEDESPDNLVAGVLD